MNNSNETTSMKSLFVYGTLKPGELAFNQIKHLIDSYTKASLVNSEIFLRDGLPALKIHTTEGYSHLTVNGFVLQPRIENSKELFEKVKKYEGTNYKYVEVTVDTEDNKTLDAYTFAGTSIDQSHPEPWKGDWTSAESPLLGYALPHLFQLIRNYQLDAPRSIGLDAYWKNSDYWLGSGLWPGLLRVEGDFLTLSSIFEHILTLKYGRSLDEKIMNKLDEFAKDELMQEAFDLVEKPKEWFVRDVSNIGAGRISPKNLKQALKTCYTVRSNLTHRGKSVENDAETIYKAAKLLSELLSVYLVLSIPNFKEVWPQEVISQLPISSH